MRRDQDISPLDHPDRRAELLRLGRQPDAWPTAASDDLFAAAFLQCFEAGASGDLRTTLAAMPQVAPLFRYLPDRLDDEERRRILLAVIGGVHRAPDNRCQGYPLLPFLLFEPKTHLSSSAALAFADHMELHNGDPLTGPRLLVDIAGWTQGQATAAGICAGLLLMGDRRTIPLVHDVLPLLDHASRVQLLLANSGMVYASVVDFYLDWLEEEIAQPGEGMYDYVAGALARLPRDSHTGMAPGRVVDLQREFPARASAGVRMLHSWSVEEYGQLIAPRLRRLIPGESEPKVLPLVLEAWSAN